ncbi:hypothetical protein [Oleidesulfovibrio sp.]|uniref:hypothetical protein n=1 Tax=Oleidesulfovibrio sp. TaxID=2909707 RepID=UPI003A86A36E
MLFSRNILKAVQVAPLNAAGEVGLDTHRVGWMQELISASWQRDLWLQALEAILM